MELQASRFLPSLSVTISGWFSSAKPEEDSLHAAETALASFAASSRSSKFYGAVLAQTEARKATQERQGILSPSQLVKLKRDMTAIGPKLCLYPLLQVSGPGCRMLHMGPIIYLHLHKC